MNAAQPWLDAREPPLFVGRLALPLSWYPEESGDGRAGLACTSIDNLTFFLVKGQTIVVNKVILIGNLGRDPEVRFTANGQAVARFSVATTEKWRDQAGQLQERTEWHNVVVWGKQAEACGQYLAKGRQVYVEGRLQTRSYDDKEGMKRQVTEVIAQTVRFLGGGPGRAGAEAAPIVPPGEPPVTPPEEDDIPF